ncbi:HNH endonuclease signature motif containing protein [Microbacterium terricola]|uniref:HNH nuclease domain-containing protein n=1 Tax=Microbacterium terricola TaxID=344163 RepID=A0ABM8DZE9_9MICO|nr:HNH endonuclease signature motif containing protein [Microbacterium terricola]UYK41220.1 HNH endonuclease [Microbacterium terricola]BDV31004.1 hypothetical protein Microterr_16640 [Microbacterium terricola]
MEDAGSSLPEEDDSFSEEAWDAAAALAPDALDLVTEVADMMSVFAAEQLVRLDSLRREMLADAVQPGEPVTQVKERSIRLELAAALRITEHAAGDLISIADALVHRYPMVLASLGRAGMTLRHAEVLVELLDPVEPELRDGLVDAAVRLAESRPVGSFRRELRRRVDLTRAQTLAERHAEALLHRRVVVTPADDGMAWLNVLMPAVEAHAIHHRITGMGTALSAAEGEERTLDQIRADVVCDLLVDGVVPSQPTAVRGIRATVAVTVPVLALLSGDIADGVPVVEGVGPIPIERARELCGGAAGWMRVLTHPETGVVLSVGRRRYRPPPELRRLQRWLAGRCLAPGCGVPASRCEIDHQLAWEHGGVTAAWNLAPLCTGHHHVKHHGNWLVRQIESGVIEWTSPMGRVYLVEPERRLPVFRPDTAAAPF